jgi:epidermal growth factor receptor substrate 15
VPRFYDLRKLLLPAILLICCVTAFAQETEESIRTQADQLFEKEQYVEATPLYLRLLALSPRSYDYNFRYGTCLLYNSYKKQDAFRYLNYSAADPGTDIRAFYFLGKAFHLNYQFNDAVRSYEQYRQKAAGKPKPSFEVDRQIEMCQNGKRLLTTITDIVVLEKKEYDKAEFFRLYNLENIGGDIIVAATYQSKIDKKKGHVPLVHIGPDAKSFYYSSYGESDTGQKDIYVRKRLPDNTWSQPQAVAGNVNTKFDEDFPYMHPGGEYLYFSSKGHNSMGGYDIFRSKINPETNAFGPPENMDFAISSPDDDLFYIVDSLDQNAWFASARQSTNGKLFVYKVRVDRVPLQLAVIKGTFASDINPAGKVSISVTDFASGEKIGTFASNDKSSYLITLPKGGKYKYEMKVDGKSDVHTYIVNVPFFKEFHPLKQKIVEERADNGEVVRVIDLFGEAVDDPAGILAEVIRNRSELNPNASQFDLQSLDRGRNDAKALAELGFEGAGPTEIVGRFETLESQRLQELKTSQNLANGSLNKAVGNLAEAEKLLGEARNEANRANGADSKKQKFALLGSAKEKADRALQLKNEAKILLAFSDSVASGIPKEQASLDALHSVTEEVRTAVRDENIGDLKDIITKNSAIITEAKRAKAGPTDLLAAQKSIVAKDRKEATTQRDNYIAGASRLETEIAKLKQDLAAAKKKDQPAIQSAIDGKVQELSLVRDEASYQDKKVGKLAAQEKEIDDKIAFLQGVSSSAAPQGSIAEARAKLSGVDSKNNNTLASYISQQYEQLKSDPAANPVENDEALALSGSYEDEQRAIEADVSLSPEARKQKLAELDKRLVSSVDEAISRADEELAKDPGNSQVASQRQALLRIKADAQAGSAASQVVETPEAVTITPESLVAEMDPAYERAMASAAGNDAAQLQQANAADRALIAKIDARLARANETLAADPSDKRAAAERDALTELRSEKQTDVTRRDEAIARANTAEQNYSPESELLQLAPAYETEMAAVSGTPLEKLEAQNAIDRGLIERIDEELTGVERRLSEAPADKNALSRQKALNSLKAEKEDAIAERTRQTGSSGSAPAIEPQTVLNEIDPDYEAQIDAASGTDRPQLERQNTIDSELVKKIDAELALVTQMLSGNPSDVQSAARKTALVSLRNDASGRISDRSEQMAAIDAQASAPEIITPEYERSALMPDYDARMAAISAAGTADALEARNEVDRELIARANDELAEIEGQLMRNPANKEAAARQSALLSLVQSSEALVAARSEELASLAAQPETPDALAEITAELRPEYARNIEKIRSSMPDGPERDLALLEEDRKLLGQIAEAVERTDAQQLKDPADEELNTKLGLLKQAQAVQEESVNERQAALVARAVTTTDRNAVLKAAAPKYRAVVLSAEPSESELQSALENEEDLRKALQKKIAANDRQLAKKFDIGTAAENKVLGDLAEESAMRSQQLEDPSRISPAAEEAITQDLGEEAAFLMSFDPHTVDDAKRILTALKEYENALEEKSRQLSAEGSGQEAEVAEEQLRSVRRRIGIVEADLDAMENYIVPVTEDVRAETGLIALRNREAILRGQLSKPGITTSEKKAAQKELSSVSAERQAIETKVVKAKTAAAEVSLNTALQQLQAEGADDPIGSEVLQRVNDNSVPAGQAGDEMKARLQSAQENLTLVNAASAYIAAEKDYQTHGIVTENPESLERQKRRFLIEIGQLEAVAGDLERAGGQEAKLRDVRNQQKTLREAVGKIDEMLAELAKRPQPVFAEELASEVSYEREIEIAAKPVYRTLLAQSAEVRASGQELRQISREKAALRSRISRETDASKRIAKVNALIEMEKREEAADRILGEQKAALESAIARSGEDPAAVKNLLAREVPYREPVSPLAAVAPGLRTGFALVENPEAVRKEKNLPVGTKSPSGLIYRVQVGAYAKPLPENLFTEFTPVTGEKLSNGITRYLAGYFGNKTKAADAQRAIRALGYADAFMVAYCDGQRISLAEARRLEESGLCVPRTQDSLIMEIVENRLAALPADSLAKLRPAAKVSDYNKASGAAPAEAVEDRQGLFFTVQVGVYNRPATREQLRGIDPLITKRLPNGQIRYSSGVFRSVEAARPKRVEAVTRGITDAFVTAYYKGERISLTDAMHILEEQGDIVLESDSVTMNKPELFEEARIYAAERPIVVSASEQPVQIVSSRTYDVYPAEELARLNAAGTFIYDPADQHIKSVVYSSQSALPDLTGVGESIDTVFRKSEIGSNFEPKQPAVVAEWGGEELGGDFAHWLLRCSYDHSAKAAEEGIQIRFEGVEPGDREELISLLQGFGAAVVRLEEE